MGEGILFWVAGLSGLGYGRAAGVGETEDFGYFVEDFAYGVVFCGADYFEVVVVFHVD